MFHDTHIILPMTDTLHWKLGTLIAQTSHGVPEARPDTWTPESQWLWSHSSSCRVASHFSPCWYWWPVGGIATTSIQPIRDLQFMHSCNQHKRHNLQGSRIVRNFKVTKKNHVVQHPEKAKMKICNNFLQKWPITRRKIKCLCVFLLHSSLIWLLPKRHCPQSLFPLSGPSSQKLPLNLPHPSVWRGVGSWIADNSTFDYSILLPSHKPSNRDFIMKSLNKATPLKQWKVV